MPDTNTQNFESDNGWRPPPPYSPAIDEGFAEHSKLEKETVTDIEETTVSKSSVTHKANLLRTVGGHIRRFLSRGVRFSGQSLPHQLEPRLPDPSKNHWRLLQPDDSDPQFPPHASAPTEKLNSYIPRPQQNPSFKSSPHRQIPGRQDPILLHDPRFRYGIRFYFRLRMRPSLWRYSGVFRLSFDSPENFPPSSQPFTWRDKLNERATLDVIDSDPQISLYTRTIIIDNIRCPGERPDMKVFLQVFHPDFHRLFQLDREAIFALVNTRSVYR